MVGAVQRCGAERKWGANLLLVLELSDEAVLKVGTRQEVARWELSWRVVLKGEPAYSCSWNCLLSQC